MIDLSHVMESQRKQIVDFIEQHSIPDTITSETAFHNIATELQKAFVHNHRGQIGGRDKAYNSSYDVTL